MARAYFRPKRGFAGKRKEAPRNGTWWIDYRAADGARRQERTPARTESEADRFAQDAAQRAYVISTGGATAHAKPMSVAAAADEYTKTVRHLVSSQQTTSYLRRYIVPELGRKMLQEVTPADVDALAATLRKKLAPATVNQIVIRVSALFTWARRARVFRGDNPVAEAARIEIPRRTPRVFTREELETFIAAAGKWRQLFLVAAWCGLRRGELCGLRWGDVDLSGGVLHVRRSYDRPTTKGKKERVVPLPSWLVGELRTMQETSVSNWVFPDDAGAMRGPRTGLEYAFRATLVRSGLGHGWKMRCPCGFEAHAPSKHPRTCPECGATVIPRAGVADISFRHLRSTCATLIGDLGLAQKMLGHSSPTITARHYYAPGLDALRAAVEAIPQPRDTGVTPAADRAPRSRLVVKKAK